MLGDGGSGDGGDDEEAGAEDDRPAKEAGEYRSTEPGGGEWRGQKAAGGNERADGKDDQAIDSNGCGGDGSAR